MTVAGQSSITYTYDDANRLTHITQGLQTVVYAYDDANRRTTATLPNGIVVTYDYDAASQLIGLTYTKGMTTLGTLTYEYHEGGNRTIVGGTWARTGLPPAEDTWTYNAANRLTTRDQATFTYDDNGDLVQISDQGTTMTFTWNARHQLVGISGGGITASFAYDGLGRRLTKTVNGVTTDFLYDGLNPIQELSGGSPVATLLTGLGIDNVISRTESGNTSTFLTDALGSTVALTDGTGAVQTEYTYEPFGATTVTGTSSTNTYQFTGRETDGTGLFYYRARYYAPLLQRFISEDPIGFAGGDSNLYGYVFNDPTNLIDPSGLWSINLEGFSGFGGGMTFGQNPGSRISEGWFFEAYAGHGYGGGATWDPLGTPSFEDGFSAGAYANASGHVLTWGGKTSIELGGHFPDGGDPSPYYYPPDIKPTNTAISNPIGGRISASIGGKVGFYGIGGKGGPGGGAGNGGPSGGAGNGGPNGGAGGRKG